MVVLVLGASKSLREKGCQAKDDEGKHTDRNSKANGEFCWEGLRKLSG